MYIGGSSIFPNGLTYGMTWKNGTPKAVPDSGMAVSIFTTGTTVYVLGSSGHYFVNGIQPPTPPIQGTQIAAMGGDIFITCRSQSDEAAIYWKNGQLVYLTIVNGLIQHAKCNHIALDGSDVYITGTINEYPDFIDKAVYWKNGQINYLYGGYNANFITISEGNVYVTGNTSDGDAYWKNGEIHPVGKFDNITGIAVEGNNIYMSGFSMLGASPGHAFFYKNGDKIILPNGYQVNGILVNETDVYCPGIDSSFNAVYWKNTI